MNTPPVKTIQQTMNRLTDEQKKALAAKQGEVNKMVKDLQAKHDKSINDVDESPRTYSGHPVIGKIPVEAPKETEATKPS